MKKWFNPIVVFIIIVALLTIGWILNTSQSSSKVTIGRTLPYVVAEVRSAVVKIRVEGIGSGSGVFIRPNLILTAGHILSMDRESKLTNWLCMNDEGWDEPTKFIITCDNGVKLIATKYYREPNLDVGFLEVNINDPNCFYDSNSVKSLDIPLLEFSDVIVGEEVFAIGSPLGVLFNSVTFGIVSALDRKDISYFWNSPLIQTDCPINPGNSGGPLFNMKGNIVGIVVGGYDYTDGLSLCIPAKIIQFVIKKYDAFKELEEAIGAQQILR